MAETHVTEQEALCAENNAHGFELLSRGDIALPPLACRTTEAGYQLALPRNWLEEHPLTEAALQEEAGEWRTQGIRMEVRGLNAQAEDRRQK